MLLSLLVSQLRQGGSTGFGTIGVGAALTFPLVGGLVGSRRPENAIGWLLGVTGFSLGMAAFSQQYSHYALIDRSGLPLGDLAAWVGTWIWPTGIVILFVFALLLFPTGHLPSRRWRPVAWLGGLSTALGTIPVAITAWPIRGPILLEIGDDAPGAATAGFKLAFDLQVAAILLMFALGLVSAVSVVLRFRRSAGEERQQLKWFALGGSLLVVGFILNSPLFHLGGDVLPVLLIPLLPAAIGIAILKYRLYDIDVVISKAVLFGALAAFITVVYVGVVVGVGSVLGRTEPDLTLQVAATALVALAFQPVREGARRLANRLVYGERAEPYEVLARFASRAAGTYATEDVLPRTARVIGEGTGAARAEVWLRVGEELRLGAAWPEDGGGRPRALPMADGRLPEVPGATELVPVAQRGELLGAVAATKPPGEPLTPAEASLLDDLAKQAGLVLRNARLTEELRARLEQIAARAEELRASRQRIVAAHDAERRRLERNIHDGAQQHLVALAVKLRLARELLARDPGRAAALLGELRAEIDQALETLRDLAGGIYPAVLEERGIAAALEDQAGLADVPVEIEGDGLARWPIETEAAVYFSCLEALQNALKHAGARRVRIRLTEAAGHLRFSVADDGRGFDPATVPVGAGLRNMADRVEALGGHLEVRSVPGLGTTVEGAVPVEIPGSAR
ncbi:MAG TPA: GAF domain-containing sensor histidine kinase [Actinomycetota bacterium]|nr:GAF domain-containing sensor histidine kinase [Actinomycetota bacterium]